MILINHYLNIVTQYLKRRKDVKSSDLVNQTFFPTVPVNLFELNKSRKLDDSNFFCGPVTVWVMGIRLYLLKSTTNQREFFLTTGLYQKSLSDPTCLKMKKMKKNFFFQIDGHKHFALHNNLKWLLRNFEVLKVQKD